MFLSTSTSPCGVIEDATGPPSVRRILVWNVISVSSSLIRNSELLTSSVPSSKSVIGQYWVARFVFFRCLAQVADQHAVAIALVFVLLVELHEVVDQVG